MKHFVISYQGDTSVTVEAENVDQALDKFWEEGLNDLNNAEIIDVELAENDD